MKKTRCHPTKGDTVFCLVGVTTAKTDEEARELLRQFGMPFKK